ncbi:MAG: hypothetical protein Q8T11_06860, partial [Elusimicrobiota bacterium]|nr:hypothetical protein [Elusimicrobiota bacterium]
MMNASPLSASLAAILILASAPLRALAPTGAERLNRCGFTLEEFLAADDSRRDEIRRYIESREAAADGRLSTRSDLPSLERVEADSRSLFDGASGKWGLSGGALAPGSLTSASPYVSIGGEASNSGKYFDYLLQGRLGAVDLRARFAPPSPADSLVPDDGSALSSRGISAGSVLMQAGRAIPLFGPFDLGVGALGMARVVDGFPNATTDESAALRMRFDGGRSVAVFGGVTQSLTYLGADWARRQVTGEGGSDLGVRSSPHAGISAWGPMAGQGSYSFMLRRQNNELTAERALSGEAAWPWRSGTASVFGRAEHREGAEIEYERRKNSVGAGYQTRDGLGVTLESVRDSASFGGAESDRRYVMLGFSWTWDKGALSVKTPVAARNSDRTPPPGSEKLVREVDSTLGALDGLLARVQQLLGDRTNAELWLPFQVYYNALTPEQRAAIETEVGPGGLQAAFNQGLDSLRSSDARRRLEELRAALSDPERLDRILTGSMRGYAARQLSQVGVSGLGGRVSLDPQALLAIFNAYSLGADPVPAIRARDIKDGVASLAADLLAQIPPDRRAQLEAALGGADLAEITGAAAAVLTNVIRRELNGILLGAMLSAESLDEVSVGRGLRPGELNAGAIRRSFAHLDDRRAAAAASDADLPRRVALAKAVERLRAE